tara:strand:+ start:318 stop:476 length:159 start_codon:yes stop_codon:yes gene_type:complete
VDKILEAVIKEKIKIKFPDAGPKAQMISKQITKGDLDDENQVRLIEEIEELS